MKKLDIPPKNETKEQGSIEDGKILDSVMNEGIADMQIAILKEDIKKIENSKDREGYRVVDKRIGADGSNFNPDSFIREAEAKIKELESVKKQAKKDIKSTFSGKSKKPEAFKEVSGSEKPSELEKAQEEFIKAEAENIDQLAEEELADQMEREKSERVDVSPKSDVDQGGLGESAIEPNEVILPVENPKDERAGSVPVTIEAARTERAGKPSEIPGSGDPISEQKIESLGKKLEQHRREYVIRDYNMDKHSSALKKIFGIGKRSQLQEFNREYEEARTRYQDTLKEYVKEISRGQVNDEEEARILAEFVNKDEFMKLADARTEIKLENSPRMEWLKRGSQKIIDRYRKLPIWKKMAVGGCLAVSGIGATGIVAYRGFGAAASAVGYKQLFEGIAQKLQSKKDIKEVEIIIKDSKIDGIDEVQRELLIRNLDASIQNIDKKIQKKKMWGKFRSWMAVGAGAATFVVGPKIAGYVGEKFQDAAELIGEKIDSLQEYFTSQAPETLSGMPTIENVEQFDEFANKPLKELQRNDVPEIKTEFPETVPPIENVEQFDELANKPLQELQQEIQQEISNTETNNIEGLKDSGISQGHEVVEVPLSNESAPELQPEPPAPEKGNNFDLCDPDLEKPGELIKRAPVDYRVEPNTGVEEKISVIDEKTSNRIFHEPKIEDIHDHSPEGQYKFDDGDKVGSSQVKPDFPKVQPEVPTADTEIVTGQAEKEIPASIPTAEAEIGGQKPPVAESGTGTEKIEKTAPAPIVETNDEIKVSDVSNMIPDDVEKGLGVMGTAESLTSGTEKIISVSSNPNDLTIFLRKELCLNDIDNWKVIRLNTMDSIISDQAPGGIGGELTKFIKTLETDWSLEAAKPLFGETLEAWTRRMGEAVMESKK